MLFHLHHTTFPLFKSQKLNQTDPLSIKTQNTPFYFNHHHHQHDDAHLHICTTTSLKNPTKNRAPTKQKMTHFSDFLKRLNLSQTQQQQQHNQHSLGIFTCFLLATCFISCFLFLDYRVITKGFSVTTNRHHHEDKITLMGINDDGSSSSSPTSRRRPEFLDEGCDLFDGFWVWDESYPLYDSRDCVLIDEGFRCYENGRPDRFYTKWRWQPRNCNLPRFDAIELLKRLQNRRVVFVGDSIGRNQWESLLCMLSSAVKNKTLIFEVNGNPITKHTGYLMFKFEDYNCTVEYYRSPFLVVQSRAPAGASKEVKTTLKLDQMEWTSPQWKDADVLIFNTGHWWNYEKTIRGGCYFQEGEDVKMGMSLETAYKKSIETLLKWIDTQVNMNKTRVFFRTFAPVHFRGGDWKTGGSCHLETMPDMSSSPFSSRAYPHFNMFMNLLSERSKNKSISLDLLNITYMTAQRKDGHSSLYYLGPNEGPASLHRQDCSHWCLPGVPDTWNELLYALLLKQK